MSAAPLQTQRLVGILVAAGSGERFGGETPKQFQQLEGRMLVDYALEALCASPLVHAVVVVAPEAHVAMLRAHIEEHGWSATVVAGGDSRRESVGRGLSAATAQTPDCTHVLIHDAARPFLAEALLQRVIAAVHRTGAASIALPVSDTLMRARHEEADSDYAEELVDRSGMWAMQTPQAFALALIQRAHAQARRNAVEATDDCSLVLALGEDVEFVRGAWWNIKVTERADWERARVIMTMRQLRRVDFPA